MSSTACLWKRTEPTGELNSPTNDAVLHCCGMLHVCVGSGLHFPSASQQENKNLKNGMLTHPSSLAAVSLYLRITVFACMIGKYFFFPSAYN